MAGQCIVELSPLLKMIKEIFDAKATKTLFYRARMLKIRSAQLVFSIRGAIDRRCVAWICEYI